MLAPFLVGVLQQVNYILPFIVMAIVTLCACVLGMFLPETNRRPTREVFEDFFEKKTERAGFEKAGFERSEYEVLPGDFVIKE